RATNELRFRVVVAIRQIGDSSKPIVRMLIDALKNKDEAVRWTAADSLRALGPAALEAIPTLTQALQDQDERVRSSAAEGRKKFKERHELVQPSFADNR